MPSQPQSSAANDRLVNDSKSKEQAQSSYVTGADTMTVEEREDEREAISRARPGGIERIVNEQRLPAEGIGAADGEVRHAFAHPPDQDSAIKRISSGEFAGEQDADDAGGERSASRLSDAERRDDIRC